MLAAGVVDVGVTREQDLRDRHDRIPLREQVFDDRGQRFGRMQPRVVEQNDAPRLHLGRYALIDLARRQLFPVERVGVPLHRREAHAVHGADNVVVIFAVRTAE